MQLNKEAERKLEEAWTELLAHIYKAVDWKKVARNKNAYDIFEHRLEFSRYEPDIPSVIQKLCNTLSLQAPPLPLNVIEFLREHEKDAMRVLRKMPKLLTLKAAHRAREMKKMKKAERDASVKETENSEKNTKQMSIWDMGWDKFKGGD